MTMGQKVKFDPTINLGHILTSIVIVASVLMAYTNLKTTDENHETRISNVEAQVQRETMVQSQILNTLGTIREDIATLKERSQRQ